MGRGWRGGLADHGKLLVALQLAIQRVRDSNLNRAHRKQIGLDRGAIEVRKDTEH
jgi:hypothetical protein